MKPCYMCKTTQDVVKYSQRSYACKSCRNSKQREYLDKVRAKVLEHYGAFCACCKEDTEKFLTLDHINNDGHLELGSTGLRVSGRTFYRRVIKSGYPDNYQILCMNCNFGKRMNNGICPHNV